MPLTSKGQQIKDQMVKEYGRKKGEAVFYASANKGKITGVEQSKLDAALARCDAAAKSNFRKPARRDDLTADVNQSMFSSGMDRRMQKARPDGGRESAMKGPINKPLGKKI